MNSLQRLSTEAKKDVRINNITSKLNLRVVSLPKSLQTHCRHMLMVSIVCRSTRLRKNFTTELIESFVLTGLPLETSNRARLKTTSPQSEVTFAVFNSSFNVGRMVSSFVIYVNAWEQTRTFLLLCKKQYSPCFQICYGNSLYFLKPNW